MSILSTVGNLVTAGAHICCLIHTVGHSGVGLAMV